MSFAPLSSDSPYDIAELNRELDRHKTAAFLDDNSAFLGSIMAGLDFVWTEDVETAATDGLTMWWNPKDFLALTPGMRKSTVLHEVWHPAGMHMVRQGDRDPQLWNIACDIEINNQLKKDGYEIQAPEFIWNMNYDGWAVEDIYDDIKSKSNGAAPSPQSKPGGTKGGDLIPVPSPEDQQKIINNVVQAAYTAQAMGKPGSVPGHIQKLINEFLKPVLPWHILFARWFQEKHNSDYTYSKRNRRYPDIYMPSMQNEDRLAHVVFFGDASCSVTDPEFQRYVSEIKYVKEEYNPEKLTFVQFDTRITSEHTYLEDEPFTQIKLTGRGGTCLKPVREYILEHKPDLVVIMSDLLVAPMEPVPCPVLWIAVNNPRAAVNFGKLIHVKA